MILWGTPATAQPRSAADHLAAQREAMRPFAWMLGSWRGRAWRLEGGERVEMVQTERVTPMLDGAALAMEGQAFEPDGRPTPSNAVGILAYDPLQRAYRFRSTALGAQEEPTVTVTTSGWSWMLPGKAAGLRFTNTLEGETWREVGEVVAVEGPPTRIFEMELRRTPAR